MGQKRQSTARYASEHFPLRPGSRTCTWLHNASRWSVSRAGIRSTSGTVVGRRWGCGRAPYDCIQACSHPGECHALCLCTLKEKDKIYICGMGTHRNNHMSFVYRVNAPEQPQSLYVNLTLWRARGANQRPQALLHIGAHRTTQLCR